MPQVVETNEAFVAIVLKAIDVVDGRGVMCVFIEDR
jgi:hypothetical protein